MSETTTVPLPCPVCGTNLRLSVTTNKNGKHAIGVHCPQDGRHFRGFINHRPFVDPCARLGRRRCARAGSTGPPECLHNAEHRAVGQEAAAGGMNAAMVALAVAVIVLAASLTWPRGPWRWW